MKTEIKVRLGMGEYADYSSTVEIELNKYETNQITELFVDKFLEYIPVENTIQAISHWFTKLRKGAKLIITGTDLVQVSKACLTKTLKVPQINQMLFGHGNLGKRSCLTLDDTVTLLEHVGLKILVKRLADYEYTIIAERL